MKRNYQEQQHRTDEFQWLGESTAVGNGRRKRHEYECFKNGRIVVNVGDHVLISNDDAEDPESEKECFVARIVRLYDRGLHNDTERNRAVVEWYMRPEELKKLRNVKNVPTFDGNEVILDRRSKSCQTDVDAETIFEKCQVDILVPNANACTVALGRQLFITKWQFDGKTCQPINRNDELDEQNTGNRNRSRRSLFSNSAGSANASSSVFDVSGVNLIDLHKKKNIDETPTSGKRKRLSSLDITKCKSSARKVQVHELDSSLRSNPKLHISSENRATLNKTNNSNCSPIKNFYSRRGSQRNIFQSTPVLKQDSVSVSLCETDTSATTNDFEVSLIEKESKKFLNVKNKNQKTKKITEIREKLRNKKKNISARRINKLKHERKRVSSKQTTSHYSKRGIKEKHNDSDDSEYVCSTSSEETDEEDQTHALKDSSTEFHVVKINTKRPGVRLKRKPSFALGIPKRILPISSSTNPLEEARKRLHVSAVPELLPCRDKEFDEIYSFIHEKLVGRSSGCMYISGVPGTGKTATVYEVMRNITDMQDVKEIPSFQFISINGMKLTEPRQVYVMIAKELTNKKMTADAACNFLEKRFSHSSARREALVLLADELDLLWTKRQDVLYNLFDWPTRVGSKLIVLAIANTMNLPERIMMSRVVSRMGMTRMIFQPYTHQQLQEIIETRLKGLQAFDTDGIRLIARKVAAVSGDARRALDICRRATEFAVTTRQKTSKLSTNLITMNHVDKALQEMFSSPKIMALMHAPLYEQLVMKSLINEFLQSGIEETNFTKLYSQFKSICRLQGLVPRNIGETMMMCERMGASRLLLLEVGNKGILRGVRLNMSSDDVNYALKDLM